MHFWVKLGIESIDSCKKKKIFFISGWHETKEQHFKHKNKAFLYQWLKNPQIIKTCWSSQADHALYFFSQKLAALNRFKARVDGQKKL